MRPIPTNHRKEIANNDWYWKCMICSGRDVEIHHVFTYGGKQIAELWNLVPLCRQHHHEVTPHNNAYVPATRDYVEWYTLMRMMPDDRKSYPKVNWIQKKKFLDTKFL